MSRIARKCPMCKSGRFRAGRITVTLESPIGRTPDTTTVVFKGVPAQVCGVCGEQFMDEKTTGALLSQAAQAAKAGVQVEVRSYAA